MDLTTLSPVQIDTQIDRIERLQAEVASRFEGLFYSIHRVVGDERVGHGRYREWSLRLADLDKARAAAKALREEIAPYEAQYRARRWSRAFLATSANGHIHSSRDCSTCYMTTGFWWFIDLSGANEAEIVTKAGSDACTICYPTAPVNDLKRPRSIFSDDEVAAQQARVNRESAKAERLAKKIANGLTDDGSEFVVEYVEHNAPGWKRDPETGRDVRTYADRIKREDFKTERAAVHWAVQYMSWGHDGIDDDMWPGFVQVMEAVAAKHAKTFDEVRAEVMAKVIAKNKRDSR